MIYLQKGRRVRVVGRLRQERWSDKEGANRERIKVVAEHVHFKKEPNTTTKAEEREELDEIDQEIAF
jgi:single-strand DNA-binding protein